jgi:hypothetical protein
MAKRLFLHVGTPKTGTTYLQSVLWANKQTLRDQGVLLPLDRVRDHFFLSNLGRDDEEDVANMPPRGLTAWDRMLDQVRDWQADVLISHELFAMTKTDRAPWIIESLKTVADEVHPVITARDLARQVPAEWQQTIKHGRTHRLREYYELVRSEDESILFWDAQDLVRQVRMWSQDVPLDRIHLVTVPPAGADDGLLWTRFASVVGIDPSSVEVSVTAPNESLGVVEAELLRRVNEFAPTEAGKPLRQLMIRQVLAEGVLAQRPDARRFGPPPEEHAWVVERGTAMVDGLRALRVDVAGDLDELLPSAEPVAGPIPDDVTDAEIAPVAAETISAVLYRSHEHETAALHADVDRLKAEAGRQRDSLGKRAARIRQLEGRSRHLEKNARDAWGAYESERGLPVWRHAVRRALTMVSGLSRLGAIRRRSE